MALTEKQVHGAKTRDCAYKLFDAEGLFLLVQPRGSKLWRFKYRFAGREKLLALGAYGNVSLAEARKGRAKAKIALAEGRNPSAERQLEKRSRKAASEDTLEVIAEEWHCNNTHTWSGDYAAWVLRTLRVDASSALWTN